MRHTLADLVHQHVDQIRCCHVDQNAADALRSDPLQQRVCGRSPAAWAIRRSSGRT